MLRPLVSVVCSVLLLPVLHAGVAPVSEGPVFLSEPPTNVNFRSSRGLYVPCTAYGRPAPVISWTRDVSGDVMTPLDDVPGLLRVLPNNTLRFLPFDDQKYTPEVHAGRFRCMATNSVGTIVSRVMTVRADLVSKLRAYNVQVNDVYVTSGNTAVLTCDVNPYFMRRHVNVTAWQRGGQQVTSGGRFSILPDGELHVRDVTSQDSYAMFSCVTKNDITSEIKMSDPATIYVSDPVNSAPTIEVPLRHVHVTSGDDVELPCVARGYPLPRYAWSRDLLLLLPDQRRLTLAGGNLVLRDVTPKDGGNYICTASNRIGTETGSVELVVTSPLSVHVTPARQTVDVGLDAAFNCTVYGSPVSDVTWLLNGRPLAEGDRVSFPTRTTLHVRAVMRSDRGMYQCVAHGPDTEALGAAQLDLGVSTPTFTSRFEDVYIRPGASASLKCVVSGNPTPSIRWTVAGEPLPRDVRYRVTYDVTTQGDVTSYVNLTQVRVEDGGMYRCTATNQVGEVSHVAKLNVYGVPYIRPLRNVTAVASHVMVVTCHVAGYPIKDVTWSKDGAELPSNHRQHVSDDGTLSVDDVTRGHDDGRYTCRAVNYEGQTASRDVYVTITEPPVIDPFRFPARKSGDRVSVSCAVSSGDLPMTLTWYKDGRPIPADLGVVTQETGSYSSQLSIGDAAPMHDGNYTCVATNRAASVNMTSRLTVHVPPRWVVAPHDAFAVLGHDVIIHCQADGKPKPQIVWRRAKGEQPGDYVNIFPDNVTKDDVTNPDATNTDVPNTDVTEPRMLQFPNGSLYIRSARAEDHGYFLCHAGNDVGRALSKVVELLVHIPATFDMPTRNVTSQLGAALTLDCEARGDRPLSVSWSFNGRQLDWEKDPRLNVGYYNTKNGRGSKLIMKATTRGDTGFYVCNGKNVFGSDVTMIEVTVQEPPEVPVNVKVKQTGSGQVDITWQAPYDGNSVITRYDVMYKNASASWSAPTVRHQPVEGLMASFSDLHPAFTYHFRVTATNSIGQSIPSDVITVTMGEEVPSGPPTKVKAVPVGSRSLNVTWKPPPTTEQNGDVTGYFIGYKAYNQTVPYKYLTHSVTSAGEDLEVTLTDLEKFTPYAIHVQAFNRQGAGPASDDVISRTLEDVPSQPPQGVQATALTSQAVLVTWSPPPLYTLHGVLQGYKVLYKPVRHDQDETDAEVLTTSELSGALYQLTCYTNYSVQVLAFTRRGEGVRSAPVYVTTKQDVPGRPAGIKAVPAAPDAILVSWRPPVHSNGVITMYTVYIQDNDSHHTAITTRLEVPADHVTYRAPGLTPDHKYSFRVSAATLVGEGETTHTVVTSTRQNVSAQVASFPMTLHTTWRAEVTLPCLTVGDPAPTVTWFHGGAHVVEDNRVQMLANGSLRIHHVTTRDAGNYTCHAENAYGSDDIHISLVVQAPPKPPVLTLAATTPTTLQVNWRSSSNGGSTIRGFTLTIRRNHGDDRKTVRVGAQARTYTASGLLCGTLYHVTVSAHNEVGHGKDSNVVTAKTNGSAPVMAPQSMLVSDINSTYVDLDLGTWGSGGCRLTSFDIRYRYWGDAHWETVDSYINPLTKVYRVPLHPATWYVLRVTAHNEAGATDSTLKLATPTYTGATIEPIKVLHTIGLGFHEKPYVMIPLIGCLVVVTVLVVALVLFCKRRQDKLSYKAENASNLRRDLTAEMSLMSDLEKRLNTESRDSYSADCAYTPSPGHNTKVTNISGSREGGGHSNQHSPNASINMDRDDDTSLYATLRCQRHLSEEDVATQETSTVKRAPQLCSPSGAPSHTQGLILSPHQYALMETRQPSHGTNAHNDRPSNRVSTVSSNTTDSSNRDELAQVFPQDGRRMMQVSPPGERSSGSTDPGVRQFTQSPPIRGPVMAGTAIPQSQPIRGAVTAGMAIPQTQSQPIRGPVMAGTAIPHYTGTPHLPPPVQQARYRPTPYPRRYPETPSHHPVYTTDNSGSPPHRTHPLKLVENPTHRNHPLTLVENPQRSVSADPLRSLSRPQNNVAGGVPRRQGSLRRSPPPPPPPRGSSEPTQSRYSPKKVKASPEECSPLFRPLDKMAARTRQSVDEDEADILLEKYYRMLQDENADSDPGPSDDVMVLDERPFSDYSVV